MNVIVIDLAHQFDVIWMCQEGWMANKLAIRSTFLDIILML